MDHMALAVYTIISDAGTWIAIVLLASAMEWRVRRLERELSIERIHRNVMEEVRNGS